MRMPKKETIAMAALTVLAAMTSGKAGAKIVYGLIEEYYTDTRKSKNNADCAVDEKSFRVILGRLHRDGLVRKDAKGLWGITKRGRDISIAFAARLRRRTASVIPKNPQDTIVIVFDVPEKRRYERDLLRFELLALEFTPLQKSVWIGYGPLPVDFIEYLKNHDLLSRVHIFSINKKGTLSSAV